MERAPGAAVLGIILPPLPPQPEAPTLSMLAPPVRLPERPSGLPTSVSAVS